MNLKIKAILFFALMLIFSTGQASAAPLLFDATWSHTPAGVILNSSDSSIAKLEIQNNYDPLDFPYGNIITLSKTLSLSSPANISFDVYFDNGTLVNPNAVNTNLIEVFLGLDQLMAYDINGVFAVYDSTGAPNADKTWYHFSQDIFQTGELTLDFWLTDLGGCADTTAIVKNVMLTENIAVPEPSTILLLCAGIAGIISIGRKKV